MATKPARSEIVLAVLSGDMTLEEAAAATDATVDVIRTWIDHFKGAGRRELDSDSAALTEERLCFYALRRYVAENRNIDWIAERYGLSRSRTHQYINQAKQLGMLQYVLNPPPIVRVEDELRMGLDFHEFFIGAVGAAPAEDVDSAYDAVGVAGGWLLPSMLQPYTVFAFTAGRTLHSMVSRLRKLRKHKNSATRHVLLCPLGKPQPGDRYSVSEVASQFKIGLAKQGLKVKQAKRVDGTLEDCLHRSFPGSRSDAARASYVYLLGTAEFDADRVRRGEFRSRFELSLRGNRKAVDAAIDQDVIGSIGEIAITQDGRAVELPGVDTSGLKVEHLHDFSSRFQGGHLAFALAAGPARGQPLYLAAKARVINGALVDEYTAERVRASIHERGELPRIQGSRNTAAHLGVSNVFNPKARQSLFED